jgi:ABC-type Zn2+ transport system substrate-binding protein/surface adhesin
MLSPKPLFSPAHLGERAQNEAAVLNHLAQRLSEASAVHAKKIQASMASFNDQLGEQGKQLSPVFAV